jgi:hypothetical protein
VFQAFLAEGRVMGAGELPLVSRDECAHFLIATYLICLPCMHACILCMATRPASQSNSQPELLESVLACMRAHACMHSHAHHGLLLLTATACHKRHDTQTRVVQLTQRAQQLEEARTTGARGTTRRSGSCN